MSVNEIIREEWVTLTFHPSRYPVGHLLTSGGLLLTMKDGSQWFHPSTGHDPVQIKGANNGQ
jgi:hypothetical protein